MPKKLKLIFMLCLIAGLAVGMRIYRLGSIPLNQDEANTTLRSVVMLKTGGYDSFCGMPIAFFQGKIPVTFAWLVFFAERLFSDPVFCVRIPAMIIGVLTILMLYWLVRLWLGRRIALVAAFSLAVMPWHSIYSRFGINVILTPFFGIFVMYLFSLALLRRRILYWYFAWFAVSAAAFWTYSASQAYIAVLIVCCMVVRKELTWIRPVDWGVAVCAFFVPLVPFLCTWESVNFFHSQQYHSIFLQKGITFYSVVLSALHRIVSSGNLLIRAAKPFPAYAPGLWGPIIQWFLLIPLVAGFLYLRRFSVLLRMVVVWLLVGLCVSVVFLTYVEDRFFIVILPVIPILIGCGVVYAFNHARASVRVGIIFAFLLGSILSVAEFGWYLGHIPFESLKRHSYGSREIAQFLISDESFVKPEEKAILDYRMVPVMFTYIFEQKNAQRQDIIDKFIVYCRDRIPDFNQARYVCLWPCESRFEDGNTYYCLIS